MSAYYLWIKALHIVAVISWMAGMLYLPRLFVYHAGVAWNSEPAKLFEVMERRLYRFIMTPAAIVVWITGLFLAIQGEFLRAGWLHGKLALVILMTAIHVYLGWTRQTFAAGTNRRGGRFFRVLNEAPTLLMIGVVVLVVLKPF